MMSFNLLFYAFYNCGLSVGGALGRSLLPLMFAEKFVHVLFLKPHQNQPTQLVDGLPKIKTKKNKTKKQVNTILCVLVHLQQALLLELLLFIGFIHRQYIK